MVQVAKRLEDRVAAGEAWLDEYMPDWPQKIDLDLFDMGEACCCVIGQVEVAEEWEEALIELGLNEGDAMRLGFQAPRFRREEYDALEVVWRQRIAARQEARNGA